jgi:hypothetical protein
MTKNLLALATLSAALLAPMAATAGLTTLTAADGWPPVGSSGLQDVQFRTASAGGVKIALGAHGYKNSAVLPNDGERVFQAQPGIYAPDGLNRANWSFDFVYDLRACSTCKVFLGIDTDPSAGVNFTDIDLLSFNLPRMAAVSWNLEMGFLTTPAFNFNPNVASSTDFRLFVTDANNQRLVGTDITVNVPEPMSLALVGVALAGLAATRRRRA